jgi:hypothetical protein
MYRAICLCVVYLMVSFAAQDYTRTAVYNSIDTVHAIVRRLVRLNVYGSSEGETRNSRVILELEGRR